MDLKFDDSLVKLVADKGALFKDVTDATFDVFAQLKKILYSSEKFLRQSIRDERIKIKYRDISSFEAELKVCDDILIFLMHTNAMVLNSSNPINNSGYIKDSPDRATCGMISVYNFLADSFKFERRNDNGQLIARIFINRDKHFFMEGRKQLGILFNSYSGNIVTEESLITITENSIRYCIETDPIVPPFDAMKEISVNDVMDYSLQSAIESGKRVGFKFENENKPL